MKYKHRSAKTADVNIKLMAKGVYPIIKTKTNVDDLKTVGFNLDDEGARKLARMLLTLAEDPSDEIIHITAYRKDRRITVIK